MSSRPFATIEHISGRIGRTNQRIERNRAAYPVACAHAAALTELMVVSMLALEIAWAIDVAAGVDPDERGPTFMIAFDDYSFLLLSVNAAMRMLPV